MAAGAGHIRPGRVWHTSGYGKAAGRACPAPTGRRNCLKRLVGSGLDRSGKVAGDGNRTRRHIYIPRNYAAAAQLRGGVKTPPYSTDDLRQPIITPAAYIFLSIPTKYEQNKCPAAFWGSRAVLYIIEFPAAQTPPPGRHQQPQDSSSAGRAPYKMSLNRLGLSPRRRVALRRPQQLPRGRRGHGLR